MFFKKLASCFSLFLVTIISSYHSISYAAYEEKKSIYESSVNWEDVNARNIILTKVPSWENNDVNLMFDIYLHPEKNKLPNLKNEFQYDIQFLNALWGPLKNPFTIITRPGKAFLFIETPDAQTFFMAPIIQNASDKNFYVFSKKEQRPILLVDWITSLKSNISYDATIKFNICNAYGNLPNDICDETSFQKEVSSYNKNLSKPTFIPSAKRAKSVDWRIYLEKNAPKNRLADSILDNAISWHDDSKRRSLLNQVIPWENNYIIQQNFIKIRNIQYFLDEQKDAFLRRITWLYPDDGCWTRASAVIRDLFGPFNNLINPYPRPSKIFAFGSLCVNTENSPNGTVSWWYHTAPIVRDAQTNQVYVLDPSLNSQRSLPVEEWINLMSSNTGGCSGTNARVDRFNICNGYAASPYESCTSAQFTDETYNMLMQSTYRQLERRRQKELGREPDKVLGDSPPWDQYKIKIKMD